MTRLALIAAGGAAGAVLRYLVTGWVHGSTGATFPAGTLVVNVLGCVVFGFVAALATGPTLLGEHHRLVLLVGFLGGFTTFSTYGWETLGLLRDGQRMAALGNVVASNVLGLAAILLGLRLAEKLFDV